MSGELVPTGDVEQDALKRKLFGHGRSYLIDHLLTVTPRLSDELQRLYRNSDRREGREKAKNANAGSPGDTTGQTPEEDITTPNAGPKRKTAGTTQRKCANCGQVGHIKTNKKCVHYESARGALFVPSRF